MNTNWENQFVKICATRFVAEFLIRFAESLFGLRGPAKRDSQLRVAAGPPGSAGVVHINSFAARQ